MLEWKLDETQMPIGGDPSQRPGLERASRCGTCSSREPTEGENMTRTLLVGYDLKLIKRPGSCQLIGSAQIDDGLVRLRLQAKA